MAGAAKTQPDEDWDSIAAVETLRRGARLSEAMAACQDLLRQRPNEPRLLILAATIMRDRRQYTEALSYLDRALSVAPPAAVLCCDVARLRRQCGGKTAAIDAYRKALSLDPACATAHCEIAELHAADGHVDDAIYHLEVAIAVEPGRLDARERLAALMEGRGMGAEAATLRRETMHRARRRIAEDYTKIRTPSSASARAQQRLRLSWAHALLVYGTAGIGIARFEEAEGDGEKAVATYRETLGVLAEAADQAKAVSVLRRVFATASLAFSQCHFELAQLHERRGTVGWAIHHLEEALRAHGSPWDDAYARLGALVERQDAGIAGLRTAVASMTGQQEPPAAYPITRWNFAKAAKQWMPGVPRLQAVSSEAGNHVAMVAATPADIEIFFAIACVLASRGHKVDLLWWPGLRFEGEAESVTAFDGWDEILMAREVEALDAAGLPDGVRLVDLRSVGPAESDSDMEAEAERLAELDAERRRATGTVYRSERPPAVERQKRTMRNLEALRRIAAYLAGARPYHMLLLNADMMESGCAFFAARRAGCRTVVLETSPDRASAIIVSRNATRTSRDYAALWRQDAPHELSSRRRERVLSWFAARTGGDFRLVAPRKRHVPHAQSFAALADHRLDSVRPVVVLFGDRATDDATAADGTAFPDSRTWILRNIDFFALHPEWQLIVRLYPQDGPSGVRTALRDKRSDLPRNVSLVESSDPKLDYQLLEVAQLGLFRTNPIGLDIAMMGVVAVAAGRPYFSGMGFTRDAPDEEAYFRMVRRALESPDSVAMTDREIELAWCFADLAVHAAPKPFPWSPRSFWRDVTESWSVKRVIEAEGAARFDKVFAILGGEVDGEDGVIGDAG